MKQRERLLLLSLLILSAAVYLNSMFGGFLLDDEILIEKNPLIHSIGSVDLLTYRWVRTLTYGIDYFFWGSNPVGYHLSNILYNTLTVLVVFLMTRRLTGIFGVSLVTALLFAVHPIHTEAVSYLSGRRDILSTLFYLLGFYVYLDAREKRNWRLYGLVLICYLAAISAKEMAITLPLCLFAYEVLLRIDQQRSSKQSLLPAMGRALWSSIWQFRWLILLFILLLASYLYMVLFVQHASGMVTSTRIRWWGGTAVSNFATMITIVTVYLRLLFFPIELHVDYTDIPYYTSFLQGQVLISIAVLVGLVIFSLAMIRRNRHVSFLILFFLITLLPVMHIIPHHIIMAEHYLYLPSYSFCLALGLVAHGISRKKHLTRLLIIMLVFLSGIYFARTVERNSEWSDVRTLMKEGLKRDPDNAVYHFWLGRAYYTQHLYGSALKELEQATSDRYSQSITHAILAAMAYERSEYDLGDKETDKAIQINPRDEMALMNRGFYAFKMGENDKALEYYLQVDPGYEEGSHLANMAGIYLRRGEIAKAEEQILLGLKHHPGRPEFQNGLAEVLVRKLEFDQAEKSYRECLRLAGDQEKYKKYLDEVREKIAWTQKLSEKYSRFLRLPPGDAEAQRVGHYLLGEIYHTIADYDRAEKELQMIAGTEGAPLEAEVLLGKTLFENGKADEGEEVFRRLTGHPAAPPDLLNNAGDLLLMGLRFEAAGVMYRESLRREPGGSDAKLRVKRLNQITDRWNQAERLAASGEKSVFHKIRGDIYSELEMKRQAIAEYESALDQGPEDSELLFKLLDLYEGEGYPFRARAMAACQRIMKMDPSNAEAPLRLARIYYVEVKDYESALDYFEKALELQGETGEIEQVRQTVETLRQYIHLNE